MTEIGERGAHAWLSMQELELLLNCADDVRNSFKGSPQELIGYTDSELLALMKQIEEAIAMVKNGAQIGAFGQLRARRDSR